MSKQINFTIVPDDPSDPRQARARVRELLRRRAHAVRSHADLLRRPSALADATSSPRKSSETVRVPVVSRIAIPFGVVPGLIAALQEQLRAVQEAQAPGRGAQPNWPKGPLIERALDSRL